MIYTFLIILALLNRRLFAENLDNKIPKKYYVAAINLYEELTKIANCSSHEDEVPYTLIHQNNSFRSISDSLYLYGDQLFYSKGPRHRFNKPIYFGLRAVRHAFHESMVAVVTRLKVSDEKEMHQMVLSLHHYLLADRDTSCAYYDTLEGARMSDSDYERYGFFTGDLEAVLRYGSPSQNGKVCENVNISGPHAMYGMYLADSYHYERVVAEIKKQITKVFNQWLNLYKDITTLSIPPQNKRITVFGCGGNGSGKGGLRKKIEKSLVKRHLCFDQFAIINTDSFKPLLLSSSKELSKLYSYLATEEAGLINAKSQEELRLMIDEGRAPHVYFDQVFAGDYDQITYGLKNGGAIEIFIVSTEVETTITRSFERGERINRYETTPGLIKSHRFMSAEMPKDLAHFGGSDITLTMVDNNVDFGVGPSDVMTIFFLERKIIIYDKKKLNAFIKKTILNLDFKPGKNLYEDRCIPSILDYLEPFLSNQFKAYYKENNTEQGISTSNTTKKQPYNNPYCNDSKSSRYQFKQNKSVMNKDDMHLIGTSLAVEENIGSRFHELTVPFTIAGTNLGNFEPSLSEPDDNLDSLRFVLTHTTQFKQEHPALKESNSIAASHGVTKSRASNPR